MEEPFVVGGIALQVQGSIGIALSPQHGDRAEALLQAADVAMYVAKRAQSRFAFYAPEQHHHTPDRLALVAELRRATDAGEMVVHYQPQADLATGKVLRAEALLRWVHPRRGLITPDEFIPLAEQVGLMRPLTLHVLGTALMQCRAWRDDGMNVGVGVNLSTQNLLDLQFPDDLARLLAKSKVPPSMIELEITEGTIMSDPRRALSVLGRLRSMGVKLAVDDFGTGYSSLAYLKDLPVNTLKIDKSFVLEMEESPDDAAIVHSTVDLARNLGLDVVAEGVENERVWRRLADYGCTLAQGYFLSKPLAAPEFTGWLAARGEPDTPATAAETAA
jgi:EAL domain-containing protein (putative c-di-GMP-specific phosphodiesterase class I)